MFIYIYIYIIYLFKETHFFFVFFFFGGIPCKGKKVEKNLITILKVEEKGITKLKLKLT
jgi:hypothetical protein